MLSIEDTQRTFTLMMTSAQVAAMPATAVTSNRPFQEIHLPGGSYSNFVSCLIA